MSDGVGVLKTYVNGKLCADVKLEPLKVDEKSGAMENRKGNESGRKKEPGQGKGDGKTRGNDAFAIDPHDFAMFLPRAKESEDAEDEAVAQFGPSSDDTGCTVHIKYASFLCEVLDEHALRKKVHSLRSADEFLDAQDEAEEARSHHLSLYKLYAKPPPAWLHPCFAALFGDAFVEGTKLGMGGIFTTLKVFNLVVSRLLESEGVRLGPGRMLTYPHSLQHSDWQSLNSIGLGFSESEKLVLHYQRAEKDSQQHRLFVQHLMTKLDALQAGAVLIVPHAISGVPILFVIERIDAERAHFTVVNTDPELLMFHLGSGQPPKIRYQTCLVLEDVAFEKVKDEAFWALAYWVAVTDENKGQTMSPVQVLYKILLPFLADKSMAEIQHSQRRGPKDAELRSPQRSETGQLRCLIEAFQFLMRKRGLLPAARKEVSLLIRLGMLELVFHDMAFVTQLSTAERSLLHIACRQVSYSASKLGQLISEDGSVAFSLEQVKAISTAMELMRMEMTKLPCGDSGADICPPPLVLCEDEMHLLRPSIDALLGPSLLGQPDADFFSLLGVCREADPDEIRQAYKKASLREHPDKNPDDRNGAEARFKKLSDAYEGLSQGKTARLTQVQTAEALNEAEVVGLYFTASWCGPCRQTTPQLAELYRKLRKKHGTAFEIVCVSFDESEEKFESYFQKMPWLALPFRCMQTTVLSEMLHVNGIPTLVLLDKKARVISSDGIRLLQRHSNHFPWAVKAVEEVPHQHTLFDRILRSDDVDPGPQKQLQRYAPIDYLQQPQNVTCMDAAIAAIRYCDRLCTRVRVQNHCVKNEHFHNIALIQFTFTQLLPLPKAVDESSSGTCLWHSSHLCYAKQLDLMLLLHRIMEHFVAAAFSVKHTRAMDAVRMVVSACIAAVADAIMRKVATDIPSEVCLHLAGGIRGKLPIDPKSGASMAPGAGKGEANERNAGQEPQFRHSPSTRRGFGLSSGLLAAQSAAMEVFAPELNVARTRVLDYFGSLDVDRILCWERGERFEKTTEKLLKQISWELAFPMGELETPSLLADNKGLLIKNYPEFRCYRDISFFFKLFQNPQLEFLQRFNEGDWNQRDVLLQFRYNFENGKGPYQNFKIWCFQDQRVVCRPKLEKGQIAPTHRFSSLAEPSYYTQPYFVESESDVLHMWDLPDFGSLEVGSTQALGQQDSEMLLSFLTAPYIRIPLVVSFFSSDDRIHSLASAQLQKILDATLFEPSNHLQAEYANLVPTDVPTSAPHLLATAHGLLLNEVCRSPEALVNGILKLLRQAMDLDTGSVKSSTASIILYVIRLGARLDNALSFLIQCSQGTHDTLKGDHTVFRELHLTSETLAVLMDGQSKLRALVHDEGLRILEVWLHKLMLECEGRTDDDTLDENTEIMCNIYAHMLISLRNFTLSELTATLVGYLVQSSIFLSTRHKWNTGTCNNDGFPQMSVPENELFETMHIMRRKSILWLRQRASPSELDTIMEGAVEAAANTNFLKSSENLNRWGFVAGRRSLGRFALHSRRDGGGQQDSDSTQLQAFSSATPVDVIPTMKDRDLSIEIDTQLMQMTLKASHPQNLPSHIAENCDVNLIFGNVTMQACVVEETTKLKVYRLVGRSHDIHAWAQDKRWPALDHWRQYYPSELFPSEKSWLPDIFGPVQTAYLEKPIPLEIWLPEDPIAHDAQIAYMIGKVPDRISGGATGVWKEIFVYRDRRMVEIYRIESYGHRFYRSLEYSSDSRFCLKALQPYPGIRVSPAPFWEKYGSGHPYANSGPEDSARVITRDWTVKGNLSFGTETFIPARLLAGVLPQTLLETHRFWQDEDDQLRGYPILGDIDDLDDDKDTSKAQSMLIFINLAAGCHVATHGAKWKSVRLSPEINLQPGRAVVLRLKLSRLTAEHASVSRVLQLLEDFVKTEELLSGPFEVNFQLCKGLSTLLRRVGQKSLEVGIKNLSAEVLNGLRTKRKRFRVSAFILPQIMEALVKQLDPAGAEKPYFGSPVPLQEADQNKGADQVSAHEDSEAVLLDVKNAPKDSYLASVADVFVRLDNLSHVLVWAALPPASNNASDSMLDSATDYRVFRPLDPAAVTQTDLSFVILPRLKLSFAMRAVDGVPRLFSLDHSDFYITNARSDTAVALLNGIPHSLLLSNANGELQVLVPSFPAARPEVQSRPFSTELVLLRENKEWRRCLDQPYFMYPVHISLSFLYSTTLASALYLLLLRFLNRDYHRVAQLVDTISSDVELTEEENQTLQFLSSGYVSTDMHPDAHACRLKISFVLLDAPISLPWDLTNEMERYLSKLTRVSANCRLSHDEELILLKHCVCDPADVNFRDIHTVYRVLMNKNRRSQLRAQAAGMDSCAVELPPMQTGQPWMYEWDNTGLDMSQAAVDTLLDDCAHDMSLRYRHMHSLNSISDFLELFQGFNQSNSNGPSVATNFLMLYDLFSGHTTAKILNKNCSSSLASMLLVLVSDIYQSLSNDGVDKGRSRGLLSSLLLTFARRPGLGQFLPRMQQKNKISSRQQGKQGANVIDEVKNLLKNVLLELQV